jgi:hypothetical protein
MHQCCPRHFENKQEVCNCNGDAHPITQQIMTEQVSSGFFSSSGFEASDQVKNHGTRMVCISFAFRTTSGMFKVIQN